MTQHGSPITKGLFIDWLVDNRDFVDDTINNVNRRLLPSDPLFVDDVNEQRIQEIKKEIVNKIGFDLGLSCQVFYEYITDEELGHFIEGVKKYND